MALGRRAACLVVAMFACETPPPPDTDCWGTLPISGTLAPPQRITSPFHRDQIPPIVVGGSLTLAFVCGTSGMWPTRVDLPFAIDDNGGTAVRASKTARGDIELVGVAAGTNSLRIYGEHVEDRFELEAAVAERFEISPEGNGVAQGPWAWLPGVHIFSLSVYGGARVLWGLPPVTFDGQELEPRDLRAESGFVMPAFELELVASGSYALEVHAGGSVYELPFDVFAQAGSIELNGAAELDRVTRVCFAAHSGDGRRLLGGTWMFSAVNATIKGPPEGNCVYIDTRADQVGETADITATVGGLSRTVTFDVI